MALDAGKDVQGTTFQRLLASYTFQRKVTDYIYKGLQRRHPVSMSRCPNFTEKKFNLGASLRGLYKVQAGSHQRTDCWSTSLLNSLLCQLKFRNSLFLCCVLNCDLKIHSGKELYVQNLQEKHKCPPSNALGSSKLSNTGRV